jgi:hypothetical protein
MIDPTRVRTLVLFRESGPIYFQRIINIFVSLPTLPSNQLKSGVNEGTACPCLCVSTLTCSPASPQKDQLSIQRNTVIVWLRAPGHLFPSPCQESSRTS